MTVTWPALLGLVEKKRWVLRTGPAVTYCVAGLFAVWSTMSSAQQAPRQLERTDERGTAGAYSSEHFSGTLPVPDGAKSSEADLPGGKHEVGVWAGLSLHSGHYLGFDKGVIFVPVDVRYSYQFWRTGFFALRYSPEVTVLSLMDEPNQPTWASTNPTTEKRKSLGGGLSPAGFHMDFRLRKRIQPFLTENSGILYFDQRVLSPQGSQLLFSTDLGLGINFFPKMRQAVTVGYRYQHMSNANISDRNPGTDANTFYVGVSRFWTKGVR